MITARANAWAIFLQFSAFAQTNGTGCQSRVSRGGWHLRERSDRTCGEAAQTNERSAQSIDARDNGTAQTNVIRVLFSKAGARLRSSRRTVFVYNMHTYDIDTPRGVSRG